MKFSSLLFKQLFVFTTVFSLVTPAFAHLDASWRYERPSKSAFDPGPATQELIDLHARIPNYPGISKQIMRHTPDWDGDLGPTQKFRPAYGPIPWRMLPEKNNTKILFIGQDGTHVAEAAGRPATAGFGGRAQSMAAYFGVEYSAAFINTYAFTIKGQYGARGAPYMMDGEVQNLNTSRPLTIIPNDTWLMSQDQSSPITQWRSDLIEKIIKDNDESLKLIVLFGGSAKDSIASFVESRGGKVGSYFDDKMDRVQVPEFYMTGAGGNAEFPVALNKEGKDAYAAVAGKRLDYRKDSGLVRRLDMDKLKDEMFFTQAGPFKNGLLHPAQMGGYDLDKIKVKEEAPYSRSLKGLTLSDGTVIDQDILIVALSHPTYLSNVKNETAIRYWESQLENNMDYIRYKADQARLPRSSSAQKDFFEAVLKEMNNEKSERLMALLNDDEQDLDEVLEVIEGEVKDTDEFIKEKAKLHSYSAYKALDFFNKAFSALSRTDSAEEARKIRADGYDAGTKKVGDMIDSDVAKLKPFRDEKGWTIEPDIGKDGELRANDFTANKPFIYGREDIHNAYYDFGTPDNRMVSESTARRSGAQLIVFGSRDTPNHDRDKLRAMKEQQPNEAVDPNQLVTSRSRTLETRYVYDKGPAKDYADMMKDLPYEELYKSKPGKSFSRDGNEAYIIKSHPSVKDFGHYRGTFDSPRVVILADPDGYDDLITARALTGTRGQYLHGLMEDLGIEDDYLVIKTVPFGMDGASESDWNQVLLLTEQYRENLIRSILDNSDPEIIISDGKYAQQELRRILNREERSTKYVYIERDGLANNSGIVEAGEYIQGARNWKTDEVKFPEVSRNTITGEMRNIPKSHLSYYARVWEGTSGDRVITAENTDSEKMAGLAFIEVLPNWVMYHENMYKLQPEVQAQVEEMKAKVEALGLPLPSETIPEYLERIAPEEVQEVEEAQPNEEEAA